jgi:hypothetical protein
MALKDGKCDECLNPLDGEQSVILQVARCAWTGTYHARCCGSAAMRAYQTGETQQERALALEALEMFVAAKRQEHTGRPALAAVMP